MAGTSVDSGGDRPLEKGSAHARSIDPWPRKERSIRGIDTGASAAEKARQRNFRRRSLESVRNHSDSVDHDRRAMAGWVLRSLP